MFEHVLFALADCSLLVIAASLAYLATRPPVSGPPGKDGLPGRDGYPGAQGVPGKDGVMPVSNAAGVPPVRVARLLNHGPWHPGEFTREGTALYRKALATRGMAIIKHNGDLDRGVQ